jgi:hypothetical protein
VPNAHKKYLQEAASIPTLRQNGRYSKQIRGKRSITSLPGKFPWLWNGLAPAWALEWSGWKLCPRCPKTKASSWSKTVKQALADWIRIFNFHVADPRHPDPDPDQNFHFDADPDPVSHQCDVNLRPLIFEHPRLYWASMDLHFDPPQLLNFNFDADPDPGLTFMRAGSSFSITLAWHVVPLPITCRLN